MRRNDREVESHDWMMEVLDQGQWMELALAGKDGWPYIVPLNYGFSDDFIIIHCAKEGKKIDLLRENNKVAFNVAVDAEIIRHEEDPTKFSMKYKSVSGRGIAEFIEDNKEKREALEIMMEHYRGPKGPMTEEKLSVTAVVKIRITEITGKVNPNPNDK